MPAAVFSRKAWYVVPGCRTPRRERTGFVNHIMLDYGEMCHRDVMLVPNGRPQVPPPHRAGDTGHPPPTTAGPAIPPLRALRTAAEHDRRCRETPETTRPSPRVIRTVCARPAQGWASRQTPCTRASAGPGWSGPADARHLAGSGGFG